MRVPCLGVIKQVDGDLLCGIMVQTNVKGVLETQRNPPFA